MENGLKSAIGSCRSYIHTITGVTCDRDAILEWFKILCTHLTRIINLIIKHYKQERAVLEKSVHSTLMLYLSQTLSSLSFLINVFVREEEEGLVLTEARTCVLRQIDCCLDSITITVTDNSVLEDPCGNFVRWMDLALEKVAHIDPDLPTLMQNCKDTQVVFEEVLSHAMSIAQVSLKEDGKIIRGGSQSVLSALNSLSKEAQKQPPNASMVRLFVDTCSNKLCALERKVNTAVLKLCIKTFSQYVKPLEKIRNFCFNNGTTGSEDFDGLVADFDLHVDRIMQIGLFAVSCSSDFGRGVRIRSCLASLEALEGELVPSLHSVLVEKTGHSVGCAHLLMGHWLAQAECLKGLIYLIIDPFAFCQVVYEECVELVDNLALAIKKRKLLKLDEVSVFVNVVKVLKDFLDKAQTEFTHLEKERVAGKLKDFTDLVEEVETASKMLLSVEMVTLEGSLRVLKRCKILLAVMKRLWFCFAEDLTRKETDPTDLEDERSDVMGNPFLDHIIDRGRQILQDRSILYKSPVKKVDGQRSMVVLSGRKSGGGRKEVPLLKQLHLRKFGFVNASARSEISLELQITDILNEITNLSTAFNGVATVPESEG